MARLVCVDDQRAFVDSLLPALEEAGHTVRFFPDGAAALQGMQNNIPDLAIIDLKMPRMDGFELIRKLRAISAVPIIMLTSAEDEVDEIIGLNAGADDYVIKGVSNRVLLQRIAVLLRRASGQAGPRQGAHAPLVRGSLMLDRDRHTCSWEGQEVSLTLTEFLLLECLAKMPGVYRTRDNLMNAAYDEDTFVDDRTIDSHIKRIRRKFREIDKEFDAIKTLYGVGYRYDA
jgi:two-component system response regulator ChvI